MIKTFYPGTSEYEALEATAKILNVICTNGYTFEVEDTYFDFGQDWKWTTIIATKSKREHYQILNPRQHKLITEDTSFENIMLAIQDIIESSNKSVYLANFR